MLNLNYHTDPGHGWLEVDRNHLVELGINEKITSYSYQKGNKVYLEEDVDMGTYLKTLKDNLVQFNIIDLPQDRMSKIRNYKPYSSI
jgi:hypothetical protein